MTTDNQNQARLLNKRLNEPASIRKARPLDLIEAALDHAEQRGFASANVALAAAREQGRQEGIRDALAIIGRAQADPRGIQFSKMMNAIEDLLTKPVEDCSTCKHEHFGIALNFTNTCGKCSHLYESAWEAKE